jgi:hypothetical protein
LAAADADALVAELGVHLHLDEHRLCHEAGDEERRVRGVDAA